MNVSVLDIRLLVVFDALIAERNVTRAASKLSLSQPAISNALRRLREIFDDELFQRTADGMIPTPRAMELAIPLAQVLRQLENVLQPPVFVPAEAQRTFRLAISPPITAVLVPDLAARILDQAPGINLRVQSTPIMRASSLLDSQAADLVIGVFRAVPKRFPLKVLYRERYVAVMSADHPLAASDFRLEQFVAEQHVLVTQIGQSQNLFDDAIARHGLQRNIKLSLTDWLVAGEIISRTHLVTAAFERTALAVARTFHGRLKMVPVPLPVLEVVALWHPAFIRHPAYEWLISQISEAVASSEPSFS